MGMAVTFVMAVASAATYAIQYLLLEKLGLEYLQTITFILVIAALVQLVEMALQKISPALYQALGVYLPLITTNCAVLGVAILNIDAGYNLIESIFNGLVQRSALLSRLCYLQESGAFGTFQYPEKLAGFSDRIDFSRTDVAGVFGLPRPDFAVVTGEWKNEQYSNCNYSGRRARLGFGGWFGICLKSVLCQKGSENRRSS